MTLVFWSSLLTLHHSGFLVRYSTLRIAARRKKAVPVPPGDSGDVQRILLARPTTPLPTHGTRWVTQRGPSATRRPFLPPFSDPNGASIGRKRDERPAPSKQALRATFGTSTVRFRSAAERSSNFCGGKNKFSAAFFELLRRILGRIQQKTRRENWSGLGELQGNKQERGQG